MGNSIKSHLENAEKTGVCQLIDMGVKEWPPELMKLSKNLRTLDLSKNRLTSIPGDIKAFSLLKNLTVVGNRLSTIAEEIGTLKKLEVLILEQNMLSSLPKNISSSSHLRTVSLSGNRFSNFPMELCSLKHLDSLNLSKNHIVQIPDSIQDLQVVELNLNQNQINGLPASMASCPRLKVLRVQENCLCLETFPKELLVNSKISLFSVEGNLFSMKEFSELSGYEQYMERYTATKKKGV